MRIAEIARSWDLLHKEIAAALIEQRRRLPTEHAVFLYLLGSRTWRVKDLGYFGNSPSNTVRYLMKKHLVEVVDDPADGRGKLVRIAKDGEVIQDILKRLEARRA